VPGCDRRITVGAEPTYDPSLSLAVNLSGYFDWFDTTLVQERMDTSIAILGFASLIVAASKPLPRRSRLRPFTVLIHAFDMRGSALAGPVPRPLHDFESSARRTGQNPSVVVRRERDRHVVLGRDPVTQLGHVHSVPRIHNVETSMERLRYAVF